MQKLSKLQKISKFLPLHIFYKLVTKHILVCLLWGILMSMMSFLGESLGIPLLFVEPSLSGETSFWTFFIVGISFSLFVLAFQVYCYVNMSHDFSFLATLKRPFLTFSVNNFVLPVLAYIYYVGCIVLENMDMHYHWTDIILHVLGLSVGVLLTLILSMFYFFNITKWVLPKRLQTSVAKLHGSRKVKVEENEAIYYYLSFRLEVKVSRYATHYPEDILAQIYRSLHLAAGFFSLLMLLVLLILGALPDTIHFTIPAGATILLVMLVNVAILGLIHSWFGGVGDLAVVALLVIFNTVTGLFTIWDDSGLRGLNYNQKVPYSDSAVSRHISPDEVTQDSMIHVRKLDFYQRSKVKKLVVVSASGGGLRATLWTYLVLSKLKEVLGTEFTKSVFLLAGSSGGNYGNFLFREELEHNLNKQKVRENVSHIGQNLLNNLGYNWILRDQAFLKPAILLFTPDLKDRGWSFERDIQKQIKLRPLFSDYTEDEKQGLPLAFVKATVVNDGRSIFMSATPSSFMSYDLVPFDIDFEQFFGSQQFHQLATQSVLRMSASFPYTMPFPKLPTYPLIEVADGGARDNSATDMITTYLNVMKPAILSRFDQVIYIEISSVSKRKVKYKPYNSEWISRLINPLNAYVQSLPNLTRNNNANALVKIQTEYGSRFDHVRFDLFDQEANVSLSWYLSELEKKAIVQRLAAPAVQASLTQVMKYLDETEE